MLLFEYTMKWVCPFLAVLVLRGDTVTCHISSWDKRHSEKKSCQKTNVKILTKMSTHTQK